MGVPGDRIHLRNGVVYRNGEALNEPYVDTDRDNPADSYRNNFPALPPTDDPNVSANWAVDLPSYIQGDDLVVPAGHYFVMGDHRGVSLDSRYWGFIPKENIIGRPMFIYWSFETPDDQYRKTAWSDRALFLGKVVLHFFDETRWRRTFQRVQ
jgi:signal peptidase I